MLRLGKVELRDRPQAATTMSQRRQQMNGGMYLVEVPVEDVAAEDRGAVRIASHHHLHRRGQTVRHRNHARRLQKPRKAQEYSVARHCYREQGHPTHGFHLLLVQDAGGGVRAANRA
jgi:hypothetical protein